MKRNKKIRAKNYILSMFFVLCTIVAIASWSFSVKVENKNDYERKAESFYDNLMKENNWDELDTVERRNLCNLDKDMIADMTTEELAFYAIESPDICCVSIYSDFDMGWNALLNRSAVWSTLYGRNDTLEVFENLSDIYAQKGDEACEQKFMINDFIRFLQHESQWQNEKINEKDERKQQKIVGYRASVFTPNCWFLLAFYKPR